MENEKIAKLETIFGFKFYDWQTQYLKGDYDTILNQGRRNGKTFIYCLRLLLEEGETFELKDFRGTRAKIAVDEYHDSKHVDCFLHELCKINTKLVNAGLKTNLILNEEKTSVCDIEENNKYHSRGRCDYEDIPG